MFFPAQFRSNFFSTGNDEANVATTRIFIHQWQQPNKTIVGARTFVKRKTRRNISSSSSSPKKRGPLKFFRPGLQQIQLDLFPAAWAPSDPLPPPLLSRAVALAVRADNDGIGEQCEPSSSARIAQKLMLVQAEAKLLLARKLRPVSDATTIGRKLWAPYR